MIVVDAQTELRTKKSSIMLQLARESDAQTDFAYKVKKYLYTIKSHPRLQEKYGKACEYLGRLYDQKQPEGMSYEEWVPGTHHRGKGARISAADCQPTAQTEI